MTCPLASFMPQTCASALVTVFSRDSLIVSMAAPSGKQKLRGFYTNCHGAAGIDERAVLYFAPVSPR
jgi:hypothetical protein